MNRYWLWLVVAGLSEIGWVSGLKHASNVWEWALTLIAIAFSFWTLLAVSKILPVGTVYAVFTGIGAAGTVLSEALLFHSTLEPAKLTLVILLIIGIGGLKMTTSKTASDEEVS
ncbi:DMT family transporter [Cohnella faecalis]|uniref:QacE family quaternary ammonium compound efflux SMR transporter n=1 Tax=Cohnella faecalis TaxID=2315694 RepID=A0A398CMV1_9BACL|nr:SMR family transporter [Cohnella faecalis]RIE02118.1 QacE family quaternary ammonium compound efflux SMR transporter [Cohnella faecalis]